MGTGPSKDTFYCNQYLNGHEPPPLAHQVSLANERLDETNQVFQPEGQMTWVILHRDLPGYPEDNTLQINYVFPDGMQMQNHPCPGQPFAGLRLLAYLPDNREGRKVLRLLDKAFNQRILFTITTNKADKYVVSTAGIPLKTQIDGCNKIDGYPDPDYLKEVKKKLKEKGIE